MQSFEDIENWYKTEDPWGYKTNPDDETRKRVILSYLDKYTRALDIGCGEGFITKDLPAKEIEGIEVSDYAAARLPDNIKRVSEPTGKYDLILCTGMLYPQYDYRQFLKWIEDHASDTILTCNISDWEIIDLPFEQIHDEVFPYREYQQRLRVFKV